MTISAADAQAAGLTQEEIDAINEVDPDQDDNALAKIAGEDGDDDDNADDDDDNGNDDDGADDGDDDDSTNDDAAGDNGTSGGAADGDGAAGSDGGDDGDLFAGIEPDDVAFNLKLSGKLLPEFEEQVDEAYSASDAKIDLVEHKFTNGEIDDQERRAEVRKIERERDNAIREINAASINAETNQQKWQAEQQAFFKQHQAYTQPLLFNALNAEVVRIANLPESAGKSGLQVLLAAKASIDKQLQAVTGKAPTAGQEQKPASGKKAEGKPKAERPGVQTLGGVPTAQSADTGGDKWAHIDKLSGMDYERALANMSDADRTAYLSAR